MTIHGFTGFESGEVAIELSAVSSATLSSSVKRTGEYSLRCNPTAGNQSVTYGGIQANGTIANASLGAAGAGLANVYVTDYLYIATLPNVDTEITRSHFGGNTQFQVVLRTTGALGLYYVNGSDVLTQIGSDSATLSTATWYRIEIKGTALDTGGSSTVECKLEGTVFATAGSLTVRSTPSVAGSIVLGNPTTAATMDIHFDDMVVRDDQYHGAAKVWRLAPDGDGTLATGFDAGTGSTFGELDDLPNDGDTSYWSATVANNTRSVTVAAPSSVVGTVAAVSAIGILKRVTNGNHSLRVRVGTTNADSTAANPGGAYVGRGKITEADPSTSAAWTIAGVGAVEVGVIHTGSTQTRITSICAMVLEDGVLVPSAGAPAGRSRAVMANRRRGRNRMMGVG